MYASSIYNSTYNHVSSSKLTKQVPILSEDINCLKISSLDTMQKECLHPFLIRYASISSHKAAISTTASINAKARNMVPNKVTAYRRSSIRYSSQPFCELKHIL
jgi:hypothetical protein